MLTPLPQRQSESSGVWPSKRRTIQASWAASMSSESSASASSRSPPYLPCGLSVQGEEEEKEEDRQCLVPAMVECETGALKWPLP